MNAPTKKLNIQIGIRTNFAYYRISVIFQVIVIVAFFQTFQRLRTEYSR